MKLIFIFLILFFFVSCKNIESKELIGSWKMRDVVDETGKNASEKATFYKGDSLIIEMFANRKLIEKQNWRYKFDTVSKIIHIGAGKKGRFEFDLKVLKLKNSEMELQNTMQPKSIRYIRTE